MDVVFLIIFVFLGIMCIDVIFVLMVFLNLGFKGCMLLKVWICGVIGLIVLLVLFLV